MQTRNNYEKEVFNGAIGRVQKANPKDKSLIIRFDEGLKKYEVEDLQDITLAYAITIHKSQGSEYKAVIVTMTNRHYNMLQRNLIYTAVTRAKEKLILVGEQRAFEIAIKNNRSIRRYSSLDEMILGKITS